MKLSEVRDEFLAYLSVEKGDEKSTILTYTDDLIQFETFTEDKDVSLLKRDDISDFIEFLAAVRREAD